jgi:hypothetical protein
VTLNATGNVTNTGNITGQPGTVSVTGSNVTNTGNITGNPGTTVSALPNGTVFNNGTLGATGNTTINVGPNGTFNNSAPGTVGNGNGTTNIAGGTTNNNGTIFGAPVTGTGTLNNNGTISTPTTWNGGAYPVVTTTVWTSDPGTGSAIAAVAGSGSGGQVAAALFSNSNAIAYAPPSLPASEGSAADPTANDDSTISTRGGVSDVKGSVTANRVFRPITASGNAAAGTVKCEPTVGKSVNLPAYVLDQVDNKGCN